MNRPTRTAGTRFGQGARCAQGGARVRRAGGPRRRIPARGLRALRPVRRRLPFPPGHRRSAPYADLQAAADAQGVPARGGALFASVKKLLGLAPPEVTAEELHEWSELLYDSCNLCGRCTLACPMGIDIASLVRRAREGMSAGGFAPADHVQGGGAGARHRQPHRRALAGAQAADRAAGAGDRVARAGRRRGRRVHGGAQLDRDHRLSRGHRRPGADLPAGGRVVDHPQRRLRGDQHRRADRLARRGGGDWCRASSARPSG